MHQSGIVDAHDLIREAITLMTNSFTNDKYQLIYSVILRASNGNDLIYQLLDPVKPDVILLDINMPKMDRFASLK